MIIEKILWYKLNVSVTHLEKHKEDKAVIKTLMIMLLLHCLSTMPGVWFYLTANKNKIYTFESIINWFFMFSLSWNWWIYNMRSKTFKSDLKKCLKILFWKR